jgi:hypothetical protein
MGDILLNQALPKRSERFHGMDGNYPGLMLTGEGQSVSEYIWSTRAQAGGIEDGLNFWQHVFSPE